MARRSLIAAFVVFALSGQQPAPNPLVGIVEKISGRELQIRTGSRSLTFYATDTTTVWKKGVFHDLSRLAEADEIRVAWRSAAGSAKLLVVNVATSVRISGVIEKADPGNLEIRNTSTNETRMVELGPETVLGASKELEAGQEVQVVGWDVGNGRVEARRIAVYNTDVPLLPDR